MPATNTYDAIQSYTLTTNATDVTFSSIPQTYTDLLFVINSAGTSTNDPICRVNSDSGNNYSYTTLTGNGTGPTASSARGSNLNSMALNYFGSDFTSLGYNTRIIHFLNYSNTTTYKVMLAKAGRGNTDGNSIMVNLWRNTNAITSVQFLPTAGSYITGSTFSLYGIKAA